MNETLKKELGTSLYIILSTKNQMVNYIPLQYFGFERILNITTSDSKNAIWDDNLKKVLGKEIPSIQLQHHELLNLDTIKRKLKAKLHKNYETSKAIFWNVTGGQRPFLLAVHDLVKELKDKTHYLCYLEGNSGKMQVMEFVAGQQNFQSPVNSSMDYGIEHTAPLNLSIALQLMGYDCNGKELPKNLLKGGFEEEQAFYAQFYSMYKNNPSIQKSLPESNQNGSNLDAIVDQFPQSTTLTKEAIKTFWAAYKGRKSLGYILEDLSTYLLLDAIDKNPKIRNKVIGLYASTKINANYLPSDTTIDEFDILILTKQGQIINFECKSGQMTGDVAKSTSYSTYAIAGVYGLPILITPMLSPNSLEINTKITKAIGAAERANLSVWYLDEIANELENYFIK